MKKKEQDEIIAQADLVWQLWLSKSYSKFTWGISKQFRNCFLILESIAIIQNEFGYATYETILEKTHLSLDVVRTILSALRKSSMCCIGVKKTEDKILEFSLIDF